MARTPGAPANHGTAPGADSPGPPAAVTRTIGRPLLPFAITTAGAFASSFFPGADVVARDMALALVALAGTAVLAALALRWPRGSLRVAAAVAYLVFVVFLVLGQGNLGSGSFALALLPVLWTGLFGTAVESAAITLATVAAIALLAVFGRQAVVVTIRRSALWGVVAAGVSIALHQLRTWFDASLAERNASLRESEILSGAVKELTSLRTEAAVVEAATRVAGQLCSPAGGSPQRSVYFAIDGANAHILARFDEAGGAGAGTIALADHPPLAQVVSTLKPVTTSFEAVTLGPSVGPTVVRSGLTHGAAVPVMVGGVLHGVLAVGGRNEPVYATGRLVDLAGIVELALANAKANEALAAQAATDPLTRCANRRGLLQAARLLPGRRPFAVIAADLDGLKGLNDRLGHEAGDAVLTRFADSVRSVLRAGDTCARIGGDEFIILAHEADRDGAVRLAERILAAMAGEPTGVSLGIATARDPDAFDLAVEQADQAMYRAKREGGRRYCVASPVALAS